MNYYDNKETRSHDERVGSYNAVLPKVLNNAVRYSPSYKQLYKGIDLNAVQTIDELPNLPVLRKSDIAKLQGKVPPLGGLNKHSVNHYDYIFQSPGPLYEPGNFTNDWWGVGRFLFACGIGQGDIVQNCFSYHLTPAGHIFESGARAVGATVIPAGTGNTELQVRVAHDIGATGYAGTPDYLKVILDKAESMGIDLSSITKAGVGGGPLFPSLRQAYADRGIKCLQNYATAEVGNIAYETLPDAGLIIDENVIVEILQPGSGHPVEEGEIGEVVVTTLNFDFPLIRFATGDLSSFLLGISDCGRTNVRLSGWKGRADQTTKVKGLFVRPEQLANFKEKHPEVIKIRAVVTRNNDQDILTVKLETPQSGAMHQYQNSLREILRLGVSIDIVSKGTLPNDGLVIDDQRKFE